LTTSAFDLAANASQQRTAEDFFRDHSFRVYLWPLFWRDVTGAHDFNWTEVPFEQNSVAQIPAQQGIYAFKLRIQDTILPSHGIIVYFGESGVRGNGSLKRRFKEYLRDRRVGPKRPKFEWLFKNWPDDLVFCYATLNWTSEELAKLEKDLSDAAMPVCSTKDFSARIRRVAAVLRN